MTKYLKDGKFEDQIIEHNGKKYKECKVQFVDELDTGIQVRATTFQISKAKQKQELRRMTQDYINGKRTEDEEREI